MFRALRMILGSVAVGAVLAVALHATPVEAQVGPQKGAGVSLSTGRAEAAGSWQSHWVKSHESSARLIAGVRPGEAEAARKVVAGVELRLSDGWKTYWRHPGDDGGLPPTFDWSASRNLKAARVLFPAPQRLVAKTGVSIGYVGGVVFPVEIEPADARRPVELVLRLEYGICREICVPAEVDLQISIAPSLAILPAPLAAALASVPARDVAGGATGLSKASATLSGPAPALTFDVAAAAGETEVDLFAEAPEGIYLPMTQKVGLPKGGGQRFRIDLKGVEDIAKLAGRPLRLTIVKPGGAVEAIWTVR